MSNHFTYKLWRFSSEHNDTLGLLMAGSPVPGEHFRCFTLEDEGRDEKVPGKTRIPAGRYEIKLRKAGGMNGRYSERWDWHRGMLHLQDVPGFEWIYIHPGNRHEHTEGCILVGNGCQSNIGDDGAVTNSVAAYRTLYLEICSMLARGRRVFIEIVDYS